MRAYLIVVLTALQGTLLLGSGANFALAADRTPVVQVRPALPVTARKICVAEVPIDGPPFGYGCLDHWVKAYDHQTVVQDNGVVHETSVVTIRRRYPPEGFAPRLAVVHKRLNPYYEYNFSYSPQSLLGCPFCR